MSSFEVSDITVPALLSKLKNREWLIPQFQREFVWSLANVIDFLHSIIDARPIGMATLWEQPDESTLILEPLSLPDYDSQKQKTGATYYAKRTNNPNKVYAVLDGRQRCTVVAMAFGGFRSQHGWYKYTGRYFLNVAEKDPNKRVVFVKENKVRSEGLESDAACISKGYFPLSSNIVDEEILPQWMRYLQALRDPTFYNDGKLPEEPELNRRDQILKKAFQGIVDTKLAVYTVPQTYSLSEICEIFETLNTTGTKVSTVDLIHSWLYADTQDSPTGSLLLREWINDFGQIEGAVGWANDTDRPELIAQIVTACHVALFDKPEPRKVGTGRVLPITSVKAGDLLATPPRHWQNVMDNDELLAGYLGDFQKLVAGGNFPWKVCPYPVSAAIYVALRWHAKFDAPETHPWGREDLDALFKAFFWRNSLTNRYDQGFLTQLGSDIKEINTWLNERNNFSSVSKWVSHVTRKLDAYIKNLLPTKEILVNLLTTGNQGGAMQKALLLPMLGGVKKDLIDTSISLEFPSGNSIEVHHVYPRAWANNNKTGGLADLLDRDRSGKDWVNSVANLMPLSRRTNNIWKAKNPGQMIIEKSLTFNPVKNILEAAFIDEETFEHLKNGASGIKQFWEKRASNIADHFIHQMRISF